MYVYHAQVHLISPWNGLILLLCIGENPQWSPMLTNLRGQTPMAYSNVDLWFVLRKVKEDVVWRQVVVEVAWFGHLIHDVSEGQNKLLPLASEKAKPLSLNNIIIINVTKGTQDIYVIPCVTVSSEHRPKRPPIPPMHVSFVTLVVNGHKINDSRMGNSHS